MPQAGPGFLRFLPAGRSQRRANGRDRRQLDFPAAGKETEDKMKYSVVIPALNEEQNVPIVAEQVAAAMNALGAPWELIFIDDGSTDGTYQAMEACREKDPRVKIIRFQRNFGQSAGWRAGFDHASGEIIISMDADLQNDAQDIPLMIRKLEEEDCDVISGWRSPRKDARHLRFLSAVGNWLRRFMTGDPTHDQGCSLKVYRRKCLEGLDFHRDLHRRYITAILRLERLPRRRDQDPSSPPPLRKLEIHHPQEVEWHPGPAGRGLLHPACRPAGSR